MKVLLFILWKRSDVLPLCFIFSSSNTPSPLRLLEVRCVSFRRFSNKRKNMHMCFYIKYHFISKIKNKHHEFLLHGLNWAVCPGRLQQQDWCFLPFGLFDRIKKKKSPDCNKNTASAGLYRCRKQDQEQRSEKTHFNQQKRRISSVIKALCWAAVLMRNAAIKALISVSFPFKYTQRTDYWLHQVTIIVYLD